MPVVFPSCVCVWSCQGSETNAALLLQSGVRTRLHAADPELLHIPESLREEISSLLSSICLRDEHIREYLGKDAMKLVVRILKSCGTSTSITAVFKTIRCVLYLIMYHRIPT